MKTYNVTLTNNANVWMRTNSSYLTFNPRNQSIDWLTHCVNSINEELHDLEKAEAPVESTIWRLISNHIESLQDQLVPLKHLASACVSFDGDELVAKIERLHQSLEDYNNYALSQLTNDISYSFYDEDFVSDAEAAAISEGERDADYEEHVDDHYNV